MLFCLGTDKYVSSGEGYQKSYRVFNKDVEKSEWEKVKSSMPKIELPLTHWIEEKNMTGDEKKSNPIHGEIGGYLKVLPYEGSWKAWWDGAAEKDKDAILNCGYFDQKVFEGITGIKDVYAAPTLKGKKVSVELDGVKYEAIII